MFYCSLVSGALLQRPIILHRCSCPAGSLFDVVDVWRDGPWEMINSGIWRNHHDELDLRNASRYTRGSIIIIKRSFTLLSAAWGIFANRTFLSNTVLHNSKVAVLFYYPRYQMHEAVGHKETLIPPPCWRSEIILGFKPLPPQWATVPFFRLTVLKTANVFRRLDSCP